MGLSLLRLVYLIQFTVGLVNAAYLIFQDLDDFAVNCRFILEDYVFDLCPLVNGPTRTVAYTYEVEDGHSSVNKVLYHINLGTDLSRAPGVSKSEQVRGRSNAHLRKTEVEIVLRTCEDMSDWYVYTFL